MNRRTTLSTTSTLLAISLTAGLATTSHAAPNCSSASSDPDGDGWGWENNESCIVVSAVTPTPEPDPTPDPAPTEHPVCQLTNSDPDGDGWGWENGQSCLVDSTNTTDGDPVAEPSPEPEPEPDPDPAPAANPNLGASPGQSLLTATEISLDGLVSANLQTDAGDPHWYKFTIDDDSTVAITIDGEASNYGVDINIQLADGTSVAFASLEDGYPIVNDHRCLPPTEYFVKVGRYYSYGEDGDYSFSIETSPFTCEYPTHSITDSGDLAGLIPGGYLLRENFRTLAAYDHDGIVQWRYEFDDYLTSTEATVYNDTIYVVSDDHLHALDLNGNLAWEYPIAEYGYVYALLVTDDTVYIGSTNTLYALSLDGVPKWMHNTNNLSAINSISLGDNNTLYVDQNSGGIMVFPLP